MGAISAPTGFPPSPPLRGTAAAADELGLPSTDYSVPSTSALSTRYLVLGPPAPHPHPPPPASPPRPATRPAVSAAVSATGTSVLIFQVALAPCLRNWLRRSSGEAARFVSSHTSSSAAVMSRFCVWYS